MEWEGCTPSRCLDPCGHLGSFDPFFPTQEFDTRSRGPRLCPQRVFPKGQCPETLGDLIVVTRGPRPGTSGTHNPIWVPEAVNGVHDE